MLLPEARGDLTFALVDALRRDDPDCCPRPSSPAADPLTDDELQLALWICYELHYRGFDDVGADGSGSPSCSACAASSRRSLLGALRARVAVPGRTRPVAAAAARTRRLRRRPVAVAVHAAQANRDAVPRVRDAPLGLPAEGGRPAQLGDPPAERPAKAALVEIQADEYGGGELRADALRALPRRCCAASGSTTPTAPTSTRCPASRSRVSNVMSLFGLHRALRGALVGHLAAYEMTSSAPVPPLRARAAPARRRRGRMPSSSTSTSPRTRCTSNWPRTTSAAGSPMPSRSSPRTSLFGAAACLYVDKRFAEHVLGCWAQERTSLRGGRRPGRSARAREAGRHAPPANALGDCTRTCAAHGCRRRAA